MGLYSKHDPVGTTDSGIHIEDVHADVPEFERVYTVKIDGRCSMKVTMKTFLSSNRMCNGELTQPNGKWLLFDPKAVADKIIDPILSPLIQKCCDEILGMDKDFMDSNPNSFIDERGRKWERVTN